MVVIKQSSGVRLGKRWKGFFERILRSAENIASQVDSLPFTTKYHDPKISRAIIFRKYIKTLCHPAREHEATKSERKTCFSRFRFRNN